MLDGKHAIGLLMYGALALVTAPIVWVIFLWLGAVVFTAWFYKNLVRYNGYSRVIFIISAISPGLLEIITNANSFTARLQYAFVPFLVFTVLSMGIVLRQETK